MGQQRSSRSKAPSRSMNGQSYRRRRRSGGNSWKYKGRRNYGNNRRFSGTKINPARYIAKAVQSEESAQYATNTKFEDFGLVKALCLNIEKRHYVHPTLIQDQTIPHILAGRDVLGLASTGSGKTLAFLAPMINKAVLDRNERCLIIVPTRELADQIQKELEQFTRGTRIRSALIIGGASMNRQISLLKQNPQFVIGTPGRMKDLNGRRMLKLDRFNNVILDEVDRMLDMGFINDIRTLVSQLRKDKQSLFFSATMSAKAEEVAKTFLNDPIKIRTEKQSPKKNVDQNIVRVRNPEKKLDTLHELLIQDGFNKVLVFSRTKRGADRLSRKLTQRGFKANAIHGDKTQSRRLKTISDFRNNSINILVATDVASRGLDIPDITHVINYDEPATFDDYVHRIGRTGRAGKKGVALTFVS